VAEQLDRLVETGVIGIVKEPEGVTLIKPPELISVKEILDAVRDGGPAGIRVPLDPNDPLERVLRYRDEAVQQALAGQTLRSLAAERMKALKESSQAAESPATA
jgi:membrane protein